MPRTIFCAECGISMSIVDADLAVETDDGLTHAECFEGDPPRYPRDDYDRADEQMRKMEREEGTF